MCDNEFRALVRGILKSSIKEKNLESIYDKLILYSCNLYMKENTEKVIKSFLDMKIETDVTVSYLK
jgi:hypothetical protein